MSPVSVSDVRTRRRHETARTITLAAQRLAAGDGGIDGFTMDDLAHAVGLSRRTLFNHFPGKDDAVLGELPPVEEAALATFRAKGPHGTLLQDLGALATALLSTASLTREEIRLAQQVFERNPRLMIRAHDRFDAYTAGFHQEIAAREGYAVGDLRARVAVAIVASLYETALDEFVRSTGRRDFGTVFADTLSAAQSLVD